MPSLLYNDMQFSVEPSGDRWDITYRLPSGASALAAAGLFPGLSEADAAVRVRRDGDPDGVHAAGGIQTQPVEF